VIAAPGEIWRQRVWVWGLALAFVVLNLLGLLVYNVGYANRVRTLQRDLREQGARLAEMRDEHQRLIGLLRDARVNRERIHQLYSEHFSTRRRRLTGITAEVKSLARTAGLVPRAITYPEEQIQQYGLIKRSFVFSVEGTYADLRKFLNLIEISDSFLTLESASLNEEAIKTGARGIYAAAPGFAVPGRPYAAPIGAGGVGGGTPGKPGALRINLSLSTLFDTRDEPQDILAPLPGAGGAASPGGQPPARARKVS
jgi:hypothetical protein